MISSRHSLLLAGLLASATFASSGAFAQAPLAAPTPPAAEAQVGAPKAPAQAKRMDRAQRLERMQAHRAERLAALKQKLRLTPAQEGAWSSFAAAQQPPARAAGKGRPDRAELAKMTTPQRLDRMQTRHAERSAMFTKRIDATRSLYAALTPEQQKTFDAESMRFGHRGHGHRHHHSHHAEPAKS
jgi:hypothetical protein